MTPSDRRDEFAEQLEEIQRQLFGYIFAQVRNLEASQEIFQQTCLVMWEKFDEFEGRSAFGTWACSIARYQVLSLRKKQSRSPAQLSDEFAEQIAAIQMNIPSAELDDRRDALRECLDKLPDDERAMITDCYSGTSVRQIAERTGRSTHGLYATLRRIREKLHACIDRTLAQREHR